MSQKSVQRRAKPGGLEQRAVCKVFTSAALWKIDSGAREDLGEPVRGGGSPQG